MITSPMTPFELRKELGMTGEAFAHAIGVANRASVSNIERSGRCSLAVALAIEALSIKDGVARIDAASLNADVAAARMSLASKYGISHSYAVDGPPVKRVNMNGSRTDVVKLGVVA